MPVKTVRHMYMASGPSQVNIGIYILCTYLAIISVVHLTFICSRLHRYSR